MAERRALDPKVGGSIPPRRAKGLTEVLGDSTFAVMEEHECNKCKGTGKTDGRTPSAALAELRVLLGIPLDNGSLTDVIWGAVDYIRECEETFSAGDGINEPLLRIGEYEFWNKKQWEEKVRSETST